VQKETDDLIVIFVLLGSALVKSAHKTFVKLPPGLPTIN